MCSGTAEDFFLDDPPMLARFATDGVPFIGGATELEPVVAASPASPASFTSVSLLSCVGIEGLSEASMAV